MLDLIGRASARVGEETDLGNFPDLKDFIVSGGTDIKVLIGTIVQFVLLVAGAIAVVYLIYGGILYITAGGDAEKATKGRTAIVNAIIGVLIIALAYVIVTWVGNAITKGVSQ